MRLICIILHPRRGSIFIAQAAVRAFCERGLGVQWHVITQAPTGRHNFFIITVFFYIQFNYYFVLLNTKRAKNVAIIMWGINSFSV